jgi:hypothetical protein
MLTLKEQEIIATIVRMLHLLASMPKTEAELLLFEESGGYEFLLRSMKEPYDPDC